jgi:thiamine-phosphate pyrophosphorylase
VLICLVTDRRRLVATAAADADATGCLIAQVRHAVDAGVDLIQIRERDLEARALAQLVTDVLAMTRGTATRVVVNDRLDVALACGADGVHLRGDSLSIAAARRLAPAPFLIGRSVHAPDEAAAADGADYLIAGTVFASASKSFAPPQLGVSGLRALVAAAPAPVLAIGGITLNCVAAVAESGAAGVAAIGMFMADAEPDPGGCRAAGFAGLVAALRSRFDRPN